jgi:hypothetical protein
MMNGPSHYQQRDLLVRASNVLEASRISPEIRAEVTRLLKLLMAERFGAGMLRSAEPADE